MKNANGGFNTGYFAYAKKTLCRVRFKTRNDEWNA